jgi:DNA-directed RNA polymerase subunit RPC12/RpoP
MECPRCNATELIFNPKTQQNTCPECGFRLFVDSAEGSQRGVGRPRKDRQDAEPAMQSRSQPKVSRPPVPMELPKIISQSALLDIPEVTRTRIRGYCDEGLNAIERGDKPSAIKAFRVAIELEKDFADAWYMLAGLSDDINTQRKCIERVLAYQPHNAAAQNVLMRINGAVGSTAQNQAEALREVIEQAIKCPHCNGRLEFLEATGQVRCVFCGATAVSVDDLQRSGKQTTLAEGMLKRKSRPTDWNIGTRRLHCKSCGASTTLTRQTMTNTCRFCQSRTVTVAGVSHHYQQPDLILPFRSQETDIQRAIQHKLKSGVRRFTRFFADEIKDIVVAPIYLPFWIFDAEMSVGWSWTNAPDHGVHPILLGDVLFFAGTHVPTAILEGIEPFDLTQGVDYDARLLAEHPAELYAIDVDQASIDVRPRLGKIAQNKARISLQIRKPSRGFGGDDSGAGRLRMNPSTKFLTYRLALIPIWLGRLTEADGDWRTIVVNDQTGNVGLDNLQKSP